MKVIKILIKCFMAIAAFYKKTWAEQKAEEKKAIENGEIPERMVF